MPLEGALLLQARYLAAPPSSTHPKRCAEEVEKCTAAAKEAIRDIPDHDFLWELADRMVGRNK